MLEPKQIFAVDLFVGPAALRTDLKAQAFP